MSEREIWPDGTEGPPGDLLCQILDRLVEEARRYLVMTGTQADLVALWIVHTWVLDAFEATPYLHISGPEKRVGKSRLLEFLALYARTPIPTANISDAALFRIIAKDGETPPTLLFDEVDTVFGPKAKNHEDLRGLLNAGYRRGAVAWRCVGDGSKQTVEPFPVFCAKAFAGIGDELPDTVADRSIPIRLKRKRKDETVERLRGREAAERAWPLKKWIESFAENNVDALAESRPELPDELDDRAQDSWEPLLALADLAGGDWPAKARAAALELSGADVETESLGVRLLADIYAAFENVDADRIGTTPLLDALAEDDEAPWADWRGNGRMSARQLSSLLSPFGIHSRTIRLVNGDTPKGYLREQFQDAWGRYVPQNGPENATTPQPASEEGLERGGSVPETPLVADSENGSNPHGQNDVADVADSKPQLPESERERQALRAEFARKRLEQQDRERAEADAQLKAEFEEEPDTQEADFWAARIESYED